MAHFAKINDDNEVLSILYIDNEKIQNSEGVETESIGQQYLQTHNNWPAEKWIQTSYNTENNTHRDGKTPFRGNYAGIGYIWDSENNMFFGQKPFPSWVKNTSTASWDPPTAAPDLTAEQQSQNEANTHMWTYEWDENNQSWVLTDLGPEVL
mgnify:FL=1|jgi:hypothetical protein